MPNKNGLGAGLQAQVTVAVMAVAAFLGCSGGGHSSPAPVQSDAVAWVQKTAVPFLTVEPSAPEGDLAPVDALVGNASIIGLGEATHGTSEFQKMKHRLLRYLVEHEGVTAFGLEAQMGLCQDIDAYVQTGQGDAATVVKRQGFWIWSTEEMLDLVNWMAAYNQDPSHARKLHFFGFDMQDGGDEMDRVIAYLQPIDPQAAATVTAWYLPFRPFTFAGGSVSYLTASADLKTQCGANIKKAYQWMQANQAAYSATTGAQAFAWALQMAKVAVSSEQHMSYGPSGFDSLNFRDAAMADNIDWYLQQIESGSRVVISAHNEHVNKSGLFPGYAVMGQWLSQRHGSSYFSLGFALGSGQFNAKWDNTDGTYSKPQVNTAPLPQTGSYEETFTKAGLNQAFLDLRNLDQSRPGPSWFSQSHDLLEIGATWGFPDQYYANTTVLPNRFDVLVYLNKVTATTFLPGAASH